MHRLIEIARLLGRPLKSRKVRVAIAAVVCASAAQVGLRLSEQAPMTSTACGVALILGIADEDNGRRDTPAPLRDDTATTHL